MFAHGLQMFRTTNSWPGNFCLLLPRSRLRVPGLGLHRPVPEQFKIAWIGTRQNDYIGAKCRVPGRRLIIKEAADASRAAGGAPRRAES